MAIELIPMTEPDYDEVSALWQDSEGVGLSASDERGPIAYFLKRNPGLSFVARLDGRIVGAALCGHDGRRGYIHHLAVREEHRRQGIGKRLVYASLKGLARQGIDKCHLFVFASNEPALAFWNGTGWIVRDELVMLSKFVTHDRMP